MSGDSIMAMQPLFQEEDDSSTLISPLHLHLKLIPLQLAYKLYAKWHYLGGTAFVSSVNFGVLANHEWHGAISYGPPNATDLAPYWDRTTQASWWELKRLALSPACQKNSESRVIAVSIKLLRKMERVQGIVTYADTQQQHTGGIYKATGFMSLGMTDQKCDYVLNGRIQQRGPTRHTNGEWIPRSRKWLFVKDFRMKGDQP